MLYKLAVKNLIFIQSKKIALKLPEYNVNKFLDESNLFLIWYLPFFKIKNNDYKNDFNLF